MSQGEKLSEIKRPLPTRGCYIDMWHPGIVMEIRVLRYTSIFFPKNKIESVFALDDYFLVRQLLRFAFQVANTILSRVLSYLDSK